MNEITLTLGGSLELLLRPAPPEGDCHVTAYFDRIIVTAKGTEMAYTLPADKRVQVRVDYVDGNGNPATVDGPVTWDTSASDIVIVDVDPGDSQMVMITPVGDQLGTAQVTARADADLGSGTRELLTMLDVTVVSGEAVAGVITPVGEPQPVP